MEEDYMKQIKQTEADRRGRKEEEQLPGRREEEYRLESTKIRAGRGEEADRRGRKTSSVMEERMPSREVVKIQNYDEHEKEKKRRFEIIKIKKKK